MNRIYKTLWSASTQSWQAVPETAATSGKKSTSTAVGVVASVALSFTLASGANAQSPPAVNQLPTGGSVARGTATINQTATAQAAAMTVNQSSQRAVINWSTFNLGQSASINFVQPNAQAVTLNRVNDSNPSQIFGRMTANGQVFLTNASGVYFSPTSSVDVGALTATTHSISDDNFMSGKYVFERNGATGKVVNEGNISAALGGYVALLAPEVQNAGVVVARAGTVAMAAGEMITLNIDGTGSLAGITTTPSTIATLIENKLAVQAPDGQIILSAVALNKLQAGVIKNSGSLEANSLVSKGGKIYLEGDDITLTSTSKIEAKGPTGGGTVLVGGDWQGGGDMRQATKVTMEAGATIDASATDNGDGGKVVLWSDVHNPDSVTRVSGSIKAEAGPNGGDGGRVETSGHYLNVDDIQVSTKSSQGDAGKWLLDPYNVTISTANTTTDTLSGNVYTPSANSSIIKNTDLQTALGNGNVEVSTTGAGTQTGDIYVYGNISWSNNSTLTLTAAGSIRSNAGVNITIGTNGVLVFSTAVGSVPYVGNILGDGSFVKTGAGSTYLTGTNTYTGTTTVSGGSWLIVGNAGTTGTIGTGNVILSTSNNYLAFARTDTNTYTNNISGAGGVYLYGGGTATLTGVNSYTGPTNVNGSTLVIGNGGTGGTGIGSVGFTNNGILKINLSNAFSISGNMTGAGSFEQAGPGTTTIRGTSNSYFGSTTIDSGATLTIAGSATLGLGNYTNTIYNNGTLRYSSSVNQIFAGLITGTGDLIKDTGNIGLILTADNDYTGTTTINAGGLQIGSTGGGTTGKIGSGLIYDNASLTFKRSNAFSLSDVGVSSAGITGTGNVNIQSTGGALTIDRNIALTGAASRIDIGANSGATAGNSLGNDLTFSGGATVSTSNTGTINVFAGSANTATLMASMTGATAGSLKYKTYNAGSFTTAINGAVLQTRNFYYRQTETLTASGLGITATKVYNKTTSLTGVTFTQTGGAVAGGIDGDSYTASMSAGAFNNSGNVGATLSGVTASATSAITGWRVAGYSFTCTACTYSGTITPKALTVEGLTAPSSRVYDGTLVASVSGTPSLLASEAAGTGSSTDGKIYTGDTVTFSGAATGTYNSKDVATANLVTFGGLTSTNANYTLTFGTQAATITPKTVTLAGLSVPTSRVYDGTLIASVSGTPSFASETAGTGSSTDGKIYAGDTVTFSGAATGTYNSKDVAAANLVTFGGLTSTNSNYTLTFGTQAATITPAPLTVTAANAARSFGAANPTLSVDLSGFVNGENATTANVTGVGSATTTANATTDAGTAVITAARGTLAAANYDFTRFVDGTLTISAISALSNSDVSALIGSQLANLSGSQVGSFTATQLQVFSPQQLSSLSASQLAGLTNAQMLAMSPAQIAAINPAKIASMTPDQLAGLSASQLAGLTASQMHVLTAAQVVAISTAQLSQLTSAQIAALTSNAAAPLSFQQVLSLTPTQIAGMNPAQVAKLTAAEIGSLSDAQLQALSLSQLVAITPANLAALSSQQVALFSVAQVKSLSPSQLTGLSATQLTALTSSQLQALSATQLSQLSYEQIGLLTSNANNALSFQQIQSLTPTQMVGVSASQVARLTAAEIDALTDPQLQALSLSQLAAISPATFASLTAQQIAALSLTQVQGLTPAQLRGLSATQIASLNAAEIAALNAEQLAAIGMAPKVDAPVVATSPVETPVAPVIANSNQLPLNLETPAAPVQEAAASDADKKDPRNKFEAAIPVMTDVAVSNAPAAVAAPAPIAPVAPVAPVAATAPQTGVLAVTILNNAQARPTTTGVAFEQDATGVTLRMTSAPPAPPVSDKLAFNDKLTTFTVTSPNGDLVEFQGSLMNKRLVVVAPSAEAKRMVRNEMRVVLAAAITSLSSENRVMLTNLDGVVLDLR